MRVSARCDYACKALLELSLHWPNKEPLRIHTISKRENIPMRYLVQILIQLKRMGFVESVRGKQGGYILARPPKAIKLADVIHGTNGPLLPLTNSAAKRVSAFAMIWKEVEEAIADVLDKVTFEDVVNKTRARGAAIVYQI